MAAVRGTVAPSEFCGPWFRRHPGAAVTLSAVLFVAVFGLGVAVAAHEESVTALFVFPISLIAFAFGQRRGLIASAVALGLTACWGSLGGIDRTVPDWVSAAAPLVLIGELIGHASDRLATAHELQLRLERAELRQREAADVNDTLLQHLEVAKWMFESDCLERGLEVLTETVDTAQALVSGLLADSALGIACTATVPPRNVDVAPRIARRVRWAMRHRDGCTSRSPGSGATRIP